MDTTLLELLADQEHARWSRWMLYMFECGTMNPDGSWTMPPEKVARWVRQSTTAYRDLSEREKDSDRKEAIQTLRLLDAQAKPIPIKPPDTSMRGGLEQWRKERDES